MTHPPPLSAAADVQKARSETTGPFDSRRIVRLASLPHVQRRAILAYLAVAREEGARRVIDEHTA